jgi:hypothetical protein
MLWQFFLGLHSDLQIAIIEVNISNVPCIIIIIIMVMVDLLHKDF